MQQKEDPNRVRITAGGNLIDYPHELTTRTAALTTTKLMWNSVISTEGAKYVCTDAKNFYLTAPLDRHEYMRMPIDIFPQEFIDQCGLADKVHNGFLSTVPSYVACMVSLNQEYLPTNSSENVSSNMATTKCLTHQDSGNMYCDQYHSHW